MRHVALIEDEEMISGSLSRLLRREGMQVRPYSSPALFLEEKEWKEAWVVVSDVSMPEMDGVELALQLRRRGYAGPVVFITALGNLSMDPFRKALEPYLLVRKPFRARDLLATLKLASIGPEALAPGPELDRVRREDLPAGELAPVDLFYPVDEEGLRTLQVARAGDPWERDKRLALALDGPGGVFAWRSDWSRYLAGRL